LNQKINLRSLVIILITSVALITPFVIAAPAATFGQVASSTSTTCVPTQAGGCDTGAGICPQNPGRVDLSTGTNGAFSADAVGTLENAGRWEIIGGPWGGSVKSPLTPISVNPAWINSANNYVPLPWATTPYVNPQTVGSTPNGGGPPGRFNYITYLTVDGSKGYASAQTNDVYDGPFGKATLPYDNSPPTSLVGLYLYDIAFNAGTGGTLYVVANADNTVVLSLLLYSPAGTLVSTTTLAATASGGLRDWWTVGGNAPPVGFVTVPSAFGTYHLRAGVYNANQWTALAVGAVFCPNSNPNGGSQGNETLVTQLNATTIHEVSFGTDDTVVDSAYLSGVTSTATGTVTFYYFSGSSCTGPSTVEGSLPVNGPGRVGGKGAWSNPVQFSNPGTYSFDAVYSGPPSVTSACELLTVTP